MLGTLTPNLGDRQRPRRELASRAIRRSSPRTSRPARPRPDRAAPGPLHRRRRAFGCCAGAALARADAAPLCRQPTAASCRRGAPRSPPRRRRASSRRTPLRRSSTRSSTSPSRTRSLSVLSGWLDTLRLFADEEPPMNARDPLLPIRRDEAEALGPLRRARLGRRDRPGRSPKYIEVPAKSPMFDTEWRSTATSTASCATPRRGSSAAGAGLEARGRPPRRPHAGDLLRRAGDPAGRQRRRRRDDLPLRPPRQAARVQRLEERLRAVDAALSRTAFSTAAAAPTTAMRSTPR